MIDFHLSCAVEHMWTETGEIGLFEIVSEGSAAAGIRRIEAVTGREALRRAFNRRQVLRKFAHTLGGRVEDLEDRLQHLLEEKKQLASQIEKLQQNRLCRPLRISNQS